MSAQVIPIVTRFSRQAHDEALANLYLDEMLAVLRAEREEPPFDTFVTRYRKGMEAE